MRGIELFLNKTKLMKIRITTLSGKGHREVMAVVEKSITSKFDFPIIAACGNDLYKKNEKEGETQPLIFKVMGPVDDAVLWYLSVWF